MNKRTKWWYAWRAIAGLVIGMIGHEAYALDFNIVTAGERGTYIQIGKDLATIIAKPAGIDLGVLPSNGSVENVKRLRYDPGIKLALVQSDVYQAFLDLRLLIVAPPTSSGRCASSCRYTTRKFTFWSRPIHR